MRPVSAEFPVTQSFGSLATAGVVGDLNGSQVQVLVAMYGNYQPFGHAGCDIGCPVGTPVYAIRAGTVVWCDWDINLPGDDSSAGYFSRWDFYRSFGGRIVLLQHDDGTFSDYCHLSEFKVTKGQRVNEGDLIGLSGDSSGGRDGVLGPHLHTEWLSDLNYSTGNGLIYGRENPETYFGTTNQTPQEGTLSAEEVKQIIDAVYTVGDNIIKDLRAQIWAVPNATLGQTFTLPDGTVTNLAGVTGEILTKPAPAGTVVNTSVDPQAIVAAVVDHLNIQITKK